MAEVDWAILCDYAFHDVGSEDLHDRCFLADLCRCRSSNPGILYRLVKKRNRNDVTGEAKP